MGLARDPLWRRWTATIELVRLLPAMLGLGLLLASYGATRSFATGALVYGAYALAETASAPLTGRWADSAGLTGVRLALLTGGVCLLALAAAFGAGAPRALLMGLGGLLGIVTSGVSGGLKAWLAARMDAGRLGAAWSVDASLLEAAWLAGPLLVSLGRAAAGPEGPLWLLTMAVLIAFGLSWRLPAGPPPAAGPHGVRRRAGEPSPLTRLWPVLALSTAMGGTEGMLLVAMPAWVHAHHLAPAWAGPLLSLFSAASIVGGLAASRHVQGPRGAAAGMLLAVLAAAVAAFASMPTLALGLAVLVLGGTVVAPLNAQRSLAVSAAMPPQRQAFGYSALYAAYGLGAGAASLLLGSRVQVWGVDPLLRAAAAAGFLGALLFVVSGRGAAASPPVRR